MKTEQMERKTKRQALEIEIATLQAQRNELSEQMNAEGLPLDELMKLSDQDKHLSVKLFTAKRKLDNVVNGRPAYGYPMPNAGVE